MACGLKNINLSQYRRWMQKRIEFLNHAQRGFPTTTGTSRASSACPRENLHPGGDPTRTPANQNLRTL